MIRALRTGTRKSWKKYTASSSRKTSSQRATEFSGQLLKSNSSVVVVVVGHGNGPENRPAFVHGLFPFKAGHGISHHAGAGLDVQGIVLDHGSADGDGGVHVAVERQVAYGAAVYATLHRFQFVDDFHGADLRRATQGAGGQGRAQHIQAAGALFQATGDVGDNVHHVGIALDDHLVGELHGAGFRYSAGVVAAQVDQHQVLGDFFRVGQQFVFQRLVFGLGSAALAGAGDGAHGDFFIFHPGQDFRRGTNNVEVAQVEEVHVRRRVQYPQRTVQVQGRCLERDRHALGNDGLHYVAVQHITLDLVHRRFKFFLAEAGQEIAFADHLAAQVFRGAGRVGGLAVQLVFQFVDAGLGLLVGARGGWVRMHNQVQFAAQVVEHHDFVGHHQQDIRGADLVGRAAVAQAFFDVAHGVVAEIAHQAAVEARQFRQVRSVETLLVFIDECQRVVHFRLFDHFAVTAYFNAVVKDLQHFLAGQANDGITAPFFTALYRFEQVRIGPAGQFQIGAEGSVQVRQYFAVHRDAVIAGFSELAELLGCHGSVS